MKLPTWAMVVGVIMLLFGGCGAINNAQKIYTSDFLENTELVSEISNEIEDDIEQDIAKATIKYDTLDSGEIVADSSDLKKVERVADMVEGIFNVSDFYIKWIRIIGIVGTIAAIIYAIAGLLLLIGRRFAVKFAYGALGLSLASALFQLIIYSLDEGTGIISWSGKLGGYSTIFINIILIVIIVASDKSYFYEHEILEDS